MNIINMYTQIQNFHLFVCMHTCTALNKVYNQMQKILGIFHISGVVFSPNELTYFIIYLGINISAYSI